MNADESFDISNDMEVIEIDGESPIDEDLEEEEVEEDYDPQIDSIIETDGGIHINDDINDDLNEDINDDINDQLFQNDSVNESDDLIDEQIDDQIDQENDIEIHCGDESVVVEDGEDLDDDDDDDDDEDNDDDGGIIISDDENDDDKSENILKDTIDINDIKESADVTPNGSQSNDSIQELPSELPSDNDIQPSVPSSVPSPKDTESTDNKANADAIDTNDSKELKQTIDMAPDLDDEVTGFPEFMHKCVEIGKCIAINKKTWNDIDIDGNDSILDCPSQVVPLMIKRQDVFPIKYKDNDDENGEKSADSNLSSSASKNMLTISNFHTSTVGKFLIGLGLSRVKQWYHKDAISKVKKQIRKEGEHEDLTEELNDQQELYNECKAANSAYTFRMVKCDHCEFRTESNLVLEGHLVYPHMTNRREYKCNYCLFMTRDCKSIVSHTQNLHYKKCSIEIPPQLYECPVCPYESGVKSKAATHITKCLRFFNPERLLTLNDELEYPTITPKPITQEDIKIYEATLQALRFAALNPQTKVPQIPGLPLGLQQQMLIVQQQQMGMRGPGRPLKQSITLQPKRNLPIAPHPNPYGSKNVSPQLYQMLSTATGHTQLIPIQKSQNNSKIGFNTSNVMKNSNNSNKPNILAKSNLIKTPAENIPSKSGTFVICEICDGYIKDLEQLRTHMQWIHKVKIHPKMLANRPPLNCQKCQWRFFTDQGLERHLLGAHGLVTSNMQDMVNLNQDGGRCTICGRVFANKLVAHMNQVHKINLKPAHLSYKCTVCSATFNLYRLFENHVYMVHSGSVKRNNDNDNAGPPKKKLSIDTSNGNDKKHVNHSVVSGNKVVLASNLPSRVSQ